MQSPEKIKNDDYKKLVELIGEKKANLYINERNYNVQVGMIFLYFDAKKWVKKNPVLSVFVLLILIASITLIIKDRFFY